MGHAARTLAWLVMASLGLAAMACGNDRPTGTPPDAAPAAERPAWDATRTIPTGTTFQIRTHTILSTEQSRPGDVFTASLAGPLVDAAGEVIVPDDALVRGRVTAVSYPTQADQPAVLLLAFEAITFAGHSYPLQATIAEVVGRTGITALPGTGIGRATGTAIALVLEDTDAILPRGTELLVRVSDPVTIDGRAPGVR